MIESCAPFQQNALGQVQSVLVADTSRKLLRNRVELQIRKLEKGTPCSSTPSVSMEQSRNTYSFF